MENIKLLKFSTSDFWLAIIAGELIAWLALPTLLNIKILELLSVNGDGVLAKLFFLLIWLFLLPLSTVTGLYLVYQFSARKMPTIFQVGKYGIVGILNTVLYIGVLNILIFFTNISRGALINLFAIIAFIISVTNGFFWNKFWVFKKNRGLKIKKEYIKFFSISSALTIINVFVINGGVNILGAPPGFDLKLWANIIFFITIPISFFGNFFGYRKFVFKN